MSARLWWPKADPHAQGWGSPGSPFPLPQELQGSLKAGPDPWGTGEAPWVGAQCGNGGQKELLV